MICRECKSGMCLEDIDICLSTDDIVFFFACAQCNTLCRRVASGDHVRVEWYLPDELPAEVS